MSPATLVVHLTIIALLWLLISYELTPDGWLRAANIEALRETLLPFAEKDKPPNETALADAQNRLKYMDKAEPSAVWQSGYQRHYFDNGFSTLAALTA